MADSIGVARFFLSMIVAGILVFIANTVLEPIQANAGAASEGTAAAKGTAWLDTAVQWLPFTFILIGFFGLVAYSVFRRRAVP